jgi:hypothetical protein
MRASSLSFVSCVDVAVIEFGHALARCSLNLWNSRTVSDGAAGLPPTSFKQRVVSIERRVFDTLGMDAARVLL